MIIFDSRLHLIIQSPASEKNLYSMPFYSGRSFPEITPDKIHKSYYPDVSVSNLILNIRSKNLLQQAGKTSIGQLILTPYPDLLQYRNCGINTIKFIQNEIKKYIIDKQIDYSAHWEDMESMLDNVLELNERNHQILKYRLGLNLPTQMTLEECGQKFGITREAVRQIMSRNEEIISHPEIEFKLRPFWITVDKLLKKREVWTSDDLAKKVKDNLSWKKKPETHVLENFLAIKRGKYIVTHNGLLGFSDSKCLNCPRIAGFLPQIMEDRVEIPYDSAVELFLDKFEEFCPLVKNYPKKVIDALAKLHISQHLREFRQFQMRNNKIINILTYVPKRRRRR